MVKYFGKNRLWLENHENIICNELQKLINIDYKTILHIELKYTIQCYDSNDTNKLRKFRYNKVYCQRCGNFIITLDTQYLQNGMCFCNHENETRNGVYEVITIDNPRDFCLKNTTSIEYVITLS